MNRFHTRGLIPINLCNIQLSRSEIATRIVAEAKIRLKMTKIISVFQLSFAEKPEIIKLFKKIKSTVLCNFWSCLSLNLEYLMSFY